MEIKHSKYKNSGILFELLIRQITADTLDGKKSHVKELLKKYFVKTELGKEYRLYETLLKKTSISESKANIIINTLAEASKNLNKGIIRRQKYNLIKEISQHYDVNSFFNHKLSNYKVYAAFYTLIEVNNIEPKLISPDQIINNKVTILEHLTAAPIEENKVRDMLMEEFKNSDVDVRVLAYKISLDKFNSKYADLDDNQKTVLKEYINSVDNLPRLKEFYTSKLNDIKATLVELNKNTKNKVTQIKISEVLNIIPTPTKLTKVNDGNLIDLLQYYDLIKELETANG